LKTVFFLFLWGFKMRLKMCLMFWKLGNLTLEKSWKIFGNIFEGACMNPDSAIYNERGLHLGKGQGLATS